MDADEIDVHEATVRRESQNDAPAPPVAHTFTQERAIEEAKTVITSLNGSSVPSQPTDGGSPAEVARVLLGHHLDHFALETMIGGGGMGAVFRARDTRLDRIVAIKVIPRVGDDAELQRRFRNEAQSAARLDHPNIARVYDVGQHGGWHYIVFEYIDGINLRDLIHRDGVLSVDDAVYYTRQVAEALDHAHKRGVVHRDIKPSNVLITTTGQAKLVDMGLARAQQLEMSEDMTASGVTLGTFDYISPEQARDPRDADVRSDIYSLGCTLYFALTGRAPYPSGTVLQKLLSHGSSPTPDPRRLRKELSANLVAVLNKMLAKQPNDRYRRPLDLISDLYQLAELEGLQRALSAGSIAIAPSNRFTKIVEYHLPWVAAFLLLFLSAGWMQILSSAGGDLELTNVPPVPSNAGVISDSDRNGDSRDSNARETGGVGSDEIRVNQGASSSALQETQGQQNLDDGDRRVSSNETSAGNGQPPVIGSIGEGVTPASDAFPGTPRVSVAPGAVVGNPTPSLGDAGAGATFATPTGQMREIASQTEKNTIRVRNDAVLDDLQVVPSDRLVVENFQQALDAVEQNSDFTLIEIDGIVSISESLRLPRRGLIIRGVSDDARLDFSDWVPTTAGEKWLFDLGAFGIELRDLDFVWKTREVISSEVSIFRMAGGNTVRLNGCTITVEDSGELGNASVFLFEPSGDEGPLVRAESGRSETSLAVPLVIGGIDPIYAAEISSSQAKPSRLVAIQLEDCIVRGGLTMLHMRQAGLMELKWDNGLLCIDGAMVRTGGAPATAEYGGTRARIILDDVTAVLGDSLVSVTLAGTAERPFLIDREANNCVFSSISDEPFIKVRGVADGLQDERLVALRGIDNYYDGLDGVSRVIFETESQAGVVRQTNLSQILGMNPPDWAREQSPQGVVNWSKEPLVRGGFHEATPIDFLQDGVVLPGFRRDELPKL